MKIIHYCKGSVLFRAQGEFGSFEEFLNHARRLNLRIWDIRKQNGIFYGKTKVKQYKQLARVARKSGIRLRIHKKKGLPFLLHRYHKRLGLWIGAVFCLCFLFVMQNFIWEIEISGNQSLSETEILEAAKELGLYQGTVIPMTDFKKLQKNLEYRLPGIAWLSLNRRGSSMVIELHETEKKPELLDHSTPCNLIAAKDGLILYMEIYQGEKIVKVKDVVCKGDMLVSGITEDKFQQTRFLHADGKVIAETYVEETFSFPLEREEKTYTGKVLRRNCLNLFGFQVPLFISFQKDEGAYEIDTKTESLSLFGKALPIEWEKRVLKEYFIEKRSYSVVEAEQILLAQIADYEAESLKNAKITSKKTYKQDKNGAFVIKVSYICEENIAQKEEIMINE